MGFRKVEKMAIQSATFDQANILPTQLWYDSLRETDDGRFSQTQVLCATDYYPKQKAQVEDDCLRTKAMA